VSLAGTTPTNATGTLDQTYGAKWISDLAGSFTVRSRYSITIGADNVFDVYPDRNLNPGDPTTANGGISNFGIFRTTASRRSGSMAVSCIPNFQLAYNGTGCCSQADWPSTTSCTSSARSGGEEGVNPPPLS
jgi:hypothetical protein